MLKSYNNKINYEVQTCTLDSEKYGKIDLIKLDVEMHELEALKGMKKTIEKYHPILIVEILTEKLQEEIYKFIKKYDYVIYNINDDKGLVDNNIKISYLNRNYILIHKDKLHLLEDFVKNK